MKNQFLVAVPEDYYLELNMGVLHYDVSTVFDLLTHVFTNYAKLNDHFVISKKRNSRRRQISPDPSTRTTSAWRTVRN